MGPPMLDRDRVNFCTTKRKGALDQMGFWMHVSTEGSFDVECVKEGPVQVLHGVLRRINGNSTAIDRTESSEVVESHNVIRMRMSVKNGVQFLNIRPEGLNSELRARIYDPGRGLCLYIDGRPHTVITGIFGLADLAFATNHGYTHGCASAQKCDRECTVSHIMVMSLRSKWAAGKVVRAGLALKGRMSKSIRKRRA